MNVGCQNNTTKAFALRPRHITQALRNGSVGVALMTVHRRMAHATAHAEYRKEA